MSKKSKKSESDEPPYMVFQLCNKETTLDGRPAGCLSCNYCGYRWGPGHPQAGQKPYWVTDGKEDNE